MSQDYDAFNDVTAGAFGIFGAEQAALDAGLKRHDSVQAIPTQHGVIMQFSCQGCGRPTQLTVEWPEMIAIKYGVNPVMAYQQYPQALQEPVRWEWMQNHPDPRKREFAWRPDLKCRHCQYWYPLRVERTEPEKYLAAGRAAGFVNQQLEGQLSQICAAVAQQGKAAVRR